MTAEPIAPSAVEDPFKLVNTRLGNYQILELLGRGGTSAVYKGMHAVTRQLFAIKCVPFTPRRYELFSREATLLSTLDHPHVISIMDSDTDKGLFYIAMEYVGGGDLRRRLRKTPKLPLDEILKVFLQVGSALVHAHENRVLHLDLKPENILFTQRNVVKLVDFGTAAVMLAAEGNPDVLMGTPDYMAPEQLQGGALSPRTDVYGLGVVLYEALAGQTPYTAKEPADLPRLILTTEAPPLRDLRPDAPAMLVDLVLRMLRKDPDWRPATILDVIDDLLETCPALSESPSQAVESLWKTHQVREGQRRTMRDEERHWLTLGGSSFRTFRYPYAFPEPKGEPAFNANVHIAGAPVYSATADAFYFATTAGQVMAVSPVGEVRWQKPLPHPPSRGVVLTSDHFVLAPTLGGGLAGFTEAGEELQVLAPKLWIAPSPIALKNVAYFGGYDSTFYLYDFFIGHPIRTLKTRGSIVTAPALTPQNRALFASLDAGLYAIKLDGEVVWRKKLDSPLCYHPTASEGGLCYALTEAGTLYALDEETGETAWMMEKQILYPPSLNYSGDLTLLTRIGEVARVGKLGSIKWLAQGPSLPSAPPVTDYFGTVWVPFEANRLMAYTATGAVAGEYETSSPLIALVPTAAKCVYGITQTAAFFRFYQPD